MAKPLRSKYRLSTEWDTIHRKLTKLRQARSIETGAAIQFQLDEQIKEAEAQLAQLSQQLDAIEHSSFPR